MKKKIENNNISERKRQLFKRDNLSQKNLYKTNNINYHKPILKKYQSIPDFRKIKFNKPLQLNSNIINKKEIFYNNYLNRFITKNNNINDKHNKAQNVEINKNKKRVNYLNYINDINISKPNINTKLNINEINQNIIYFKLNKAIKNNSNLSLKIKNNIKKNKNNYTRSFIEENNKICENEKFSVQKMKHKNKNNNKLISTKQLNEQFSMNKNRAKTFSNIYPTENIILNYFPVLNNTNKSHKNYNSYVNNYSICSNQVEYNAIKRQISKKYLKENDNKNFIININQISKISPRIKIMQKDKNDNDIRNVNEEIINKENDIKITKQINDVNKVNNIDITKNEIKKKKNINNNFNNVKNIYNKKNNEKTLDNKNEKEKINNIITKENNNNFKEKIKDNNKSNENKNNSINNNNKSDNINDNNKLNENKNNNKNTRFNDNINENNKSNEYKGNNNNKFNNNIKYNDELNEKKGNNNKNNKFNNNINDDNIINENKVNNNKNKYIGNINDNNKSNENGDNNN